MNYVTEVAEYFLARFPNVTILSPMDYTIIAEWEKQEIPLALVLRSIDEVYIEHKDKTIEIESIGKCRETVKSNFREWLKIPGNS